MELKELKARMGHIKREKNNVRRELAGMESGLSRNQLLELSEAVKYFSNHLQTSQSSLEFAEKRKILRMLIHEIQIGKDDITVNHIIPVKKNSTSDKIARLCSSCKGAKTQRFEMPAL